MLTETEKQEIESLIKKMMEKTEQLKNMTTHDIMLKALEGIDYIKEHNTIEARNPEPEEIHDNIEIIDSNTSDIRYLLNNLIDQTGIIESIKIEFKISLTSKILTELSKNRTLLQEKNIHWTIKNNDEYLELTIKQAR